MSITSRILKITKNELLIPSACLALSVRNKSSHVYTSPEWDDYGKREDSHGRKRWFTIPDKQRWDYYDDVVWPPNHKERGESKRGEFFYVKERVKHSPLKLWYPCQFVRNRSVDEALKQLQFFSRKAALILIDCLSEARKQAVEENKIEFATDMYIAEAYPIQSFVLKSNRRHARNRWGEVRFRYSDIFLRLEEGPPPPLGSRNRWPQHNGWNMMKDYLENMRNRRIELGL